MALIKCSECGQMVSDKAEACPHCGKPINEAEPQAGKQYNNGNRITSQKSSASKICQRIIGGLFIIPTINTFYHLCYGEFSISAAIIVLILAASSLFFFLLRWKIALCVYVCGMLFSTYIYKTERETEEDKENISQTSTELDEQYNSDSELSMQEEESQKFVEGGFVYVGTETSSPSQYKDYTTTVEYTVTLYKDGTATWKEHWSFSNGQDSYDKNFDTDVKWEEKTVSKHDKVYTWYIVTGKAYNGSDWYNARLGALDNQGRLYTVFVDDEDMIKKMDSGKYTCTVERREL